MTNTVTLNIQSSIAHLTLNRADTCNAFDNSMVELLTQHLITIQQSKEIRVVILQGEGPHFSAGADLNWMKKMAQFSMEENLADAKALARMMRLLNECPKPTVARVQGSAFGGAVGMIACCDLVVASVETKFCLSEVKLGLIPAVISPYVIQAMGFRNARRYMLTAEILSAKEAHRIGLVHEMVEKDALDQKVNELANNLCKNAPEAVSQCKGLVHRLMNLSQTPEATDDHTARLISERRVSTEAQKGLKAFFNKEIPRW